MAPRVPGLLLNHTGRQVSPWALEKAQAKWITAKWHHSTNVFTLEWAHKMSAATIANLKGSPSCLLFSGKISKWVWPRFRSNYSVSWDWEHEPFNSIVSVSSNPSFSICRSRWPLKPHFLGELILPLQDPPGWVPSMERTSVVVIILPFVSCLPKDMLLTIYLCPS